MAGAALQRSKNNIPPQATTLRPYIVIKKPEGVIKNFQNAAKPIAAEVVHFCLGGN
jgi:hypothetical protein